MKKILLIPGSFNPVTNAHIEMAKAAMKKIQADECYFIPAHDTYVAKKGTLIPGRARCALIRSCCGMGVIDIEVEAFFPQKTYDTISSLRGTMNKNFEFTEFYICLGMDNIKTLTSWYNWVPFVEENKFVACVRNGEELEKALLDAGLEGYKERFTEIKIPENHTSSSLVRKLCEQGRWSEVKELVPDTVYRYLKRFCEVIERI